MFYGASLQNQELGGRLAAAMKGSPSTSYGTSKLMPCYVYFAGKVFFASERVTALEFLFNRGAKAEFLRLFFFGTQDGADRGEDDQRGNQHHRRDRFTQD